MNEHSAGYEMTKRYYADGTGEWSKDMLQMLVARDRLTAKEYKEITGENYAS